MFLSILLLVVTDVPPHQWHFDILAPLLFETNALLVPNQLLHLLFQIHKLYLNEKSINYKNSIIECVVKDVKIYFIGLKKDLFGLF